MGKQKSKKARMAQYQSNKTQHCSFHLNDCKTLGTNTHLRLVLVWLNIHLSCNNPNTKSIWKII